LNGLLVAELKKPRYLKKASAQILAIQIEGRDTLRERAGFCPKAVKVRSGLMSDMLQLVVRCT